MITLITLSPLSITVDIVHPLVATIHFLVHKMQIFRCQIFYAGEIKILSKDKNQLKTNSIITVRLIIIIQQSHNPWPL